MHNAQSVVYVAVCAAENLAVLGVLSQRQVPEPAPNLMCVWGGKAAAGQFEWRLYYLVTTLADCERDKEVLDVLYT